MKSTFEVSDKLFELYHRVHRLINESMTEEGVSLARSKFLLIDQSTNGTFVNSIDGEESFVRRDSMQLKGVGMIGLGKVPEADSPLTIRFVCEDA